MGSTNVLSSKLKELRKHYAAKSTILLNSEVFRLHRSSLPPVDLLILSAFLCHCSNPVANKRGQHLTLTCVNSTLVASRPLICTDLPSSQAGPSTTVGMHFSKWVQIFQKKSVLGNFRSPRVQIKRDRCLLKKERIFQELMVYTAMQLSGTAACV